MGLYIVPRNNEFTELLQTQDINSSFQFEIQRVFYTSVINKFKGNPFKSRKIKEKYHGTADKFGKC